MKDIFQRDEVKFVIDDYIISQLMPIIKSKFNLDTYSSLGEYEITSLYFDTKDLRSFREKQDGDNLKSKIRYRYYNDDRNGFLEIKKRMDKYVHKNRYRLSDQDFSEHSLRLIKKIGLDLSEFYHFHPQIWIKYTRQAWTEKRNPSIRITIDKNIRHCKFRGRTQHFKSSRFLKANERILEIKFDHKTRLITELINQLDKYHQSVSKYYGCMSELKNI